MSLKNRFTKLPDSGIIVDNDKILMVMRKSLTEYVIVFSNFPQGPIIGLRDRDVLIEALGLQAEEATPAQEGSPALPLEGKTLIAAA